MNNYFYEVFENMPRQGPGDNNSTRRAYALIKDQLPSRPEILDIGCGKGVQTLELAKISKGKVIAVDNHQFFLDCLEAEAEKNGLHSMISCINADMASLPFREKSFDVIWSEGAVFVIGIREGLKQWKNYLRKEGFLVLSDLVWLQDKRPEELIHYLEQEGIVLLTRDQVLASAGLEGYSLIAHFTLPRTSWIEEYILPQEKILPALKKKYAFIGEAMQTFKSFELEHQMFRKYLGYFGYEFLIWRL